MATVQIKHVGFTLPSPMEREFHKIATEEQRHNPMTPGELVAEFRELSRAGGKRARELGIKEEDIDRIIHEHRQQNKSTNRA